MNDLLLAACLLVGRGRHHHARLHELQQRRDDGEEAHPEAKDVEENGGLAGVEVEQPVDGGVDAGHQGIARRPGRSR